MMLIFTIYWFFSVRTAEIEVKNSRGKKVPRIFLELSDNKKCIKMFTCAMRTHIYAYLVLIRCLSAPTQLFFAPKIPFSCCEGIHAIQTAMYNDMTSTSIQHACDMIDSARRLEFVRDFQAAAAEEHYNLFGSFCMNV